MINKSNYDFWYTEITMNYLSVVTINLNFEFQIKVTIET